MGAAFYRLSYGAKLLRRLLLARIHFPYRHSGGFLSSGRFLRMSICRGAWNCLRGSCIRCTRRCRFCLAGLPRGIVACVSPGVLWNTYPIPMALSVPIANTLRRNVLAANRRDGFDRPYRTLAHCQSYVGECEQGKSECAIHGNFLSLRRG